MRKWFNKLHRDDKSYLFLAFVLLIIMVIAIYDDPKKIIGIIIIYSSLIFLIGMITYIDWR